MTGRSFDGLFKMIKADLLRRVTVHCLTPPPVSLRWRSRLRLAGAIVLLAPAVAWPADPPDAVVGGNWISQGPGPAQVGQVEGITDREVVGAVHALAAHPSDADILYVGAVNGGIWKTLNALDPSPFWFPMTDTKKALSIGALEFDPTDGTNQTLVAGIGRYSSFARKGGSREGLLKTVDGGTNWTSIDGGLLTKNISGVAPRGSTIVVSVNIADSFSCPNIGIWRSTDGGTSFSKLSVAQGVPDGVAYDLATDRSSTSTLYTGIVVAAACTEGVMTNGIYKSTDTGANWSKVSSAAMDALLIDSTTSNVEVAADGVHVFVNIVNSGQPAGIFHSGNGGSSWTAMDLPRTPEGSVNAITSPAVLTPGTPIIITTPLLSPHGLSSGGEVEVSSVAGTTGANGVWTVSVIDANNFSLNGSSDATAWTLDTGSWTRVVGMNPSLKPGGQGGIHTSIVGNPSAPATLYMGGDRQDSPGANSLGALDFSGRLFRGNSAVAPSGVIPSPQWAHLTHSDSVAATPAGGTASSSAPHADSREMVFDANGNLLEADDGGVYRRSSPTDNTGDWFSINGNLKVSEQHDVAYDTVSDIIISGNQDTGTTQQITPGTLVWTSIHTGDGGDVGVDATSVASMSTRYSSFQNSSAFRRRVYNSSNVLQSQVFPERTVTAPDETPVYPFLTPVELNALTPTRLIIFACNAVFESLDQGDTLNQIPGLLNSMCLGAPAPILSFQNAIAYGGVSGAVNNEDILYVGSNSTVYVRTAVDPAPLVLLAAYPGAANVADIALDPDEWKTVYVVDNTKVYRSLDTGATWTDLTGNLPAAMNQMKSIEYIEGSPDVVVVGGPAGVYQLDTSSGSPYMWDQLGTGLPNAPVWDLDYDATDDVLVAGTLGRGAWKLSMGSAFGPEFESIPDPDSMLDFGDHNIGEESASMQVTVSNLGDENLTLECAFGGANPGDFNENACTTPVAPNGFTDILVSCQPTAAGARAATLVVTSNDPDEITNTFILECNGVNPGGDLIQMDGFEDP